MKFTPWRKDPKDGQPSVSLTLMCISFFIACVAIGLNIAKYTDNTSSSAELFMACAGLYFGRRMSFKGNDFGPTDSSTTTTETVSSEVTTEKKES